MQPRAAFPSSTVVQLRPFQFFTQLLQGLPAHQIVVSGSAFRSIGHHLRQ
jgi:hypothetical protein